MAIPPIYAEENLDFRTLALRFFPMDKNFHQNTLLRQSQHHPRLVVWQLHGCKAFEAILVLQTRFIALILGCFGDALRMHCEFSMHWG